MLVSVTATTPVSSLIDVLTGILGLEGFASGRVRGTLEVGSLGLGDALVVEMGRAGPCGFEQRHGWTDGVLVRVL